MLADDRIRLEHMIEAGEAVARLITGRTRPDLDSDEMPTLALARAIEIIGEAASRLSSQIRTAAPMIPWGDPMG